VHTWHRLVDNFRVADIAGEITVDPDPVHLSASANLFFPHNGYVVLALAGNRAGIAPNANIEVYRHPPLIPLAIFVLGP
jgi:hypothetical protein